MKTWPLHNVRLKHAFFEQIEQEDPLEQAKRVCSLLPTMMGGFGSSATSYQISRSLRLRSAAQASLTRVYGTPTSATVWTMSGWIKRGALGNGTNNRWLFSAAAAYDGICFTGSGDSLQVFRNNASEAISTAIYRDPSAHMHVVMSANGTALNVWVNNSQVISKTMAAAFTYLNTSTRTHVIGSFNGATIEGQFFDSLISEFNFIDGQALDPSYFGQADANGTWQPIKYTGTYGANGCYLNFTDNSAATAATIGADSSGNGNNWTPAGISVAAGTTCDSLTDTPTNYGTDTGAGGEVRGNYCVVSPKSIASSTSGTGATADGNLKINSNRTTDEWYQGSMAIPSSGKWYFEVEMTAIDTGTSPFFYAGVMDGAIARGTAVPFTGGVGVIRAWNIGTGNKDDGTTAVAYGTAGALSEWVGVAVDMDNGKIFFRRSTGWMGSGDPVAGTNAAYTDLVSLAKTWFPYFQQNGATTSTMQVNFGQYAFAYTAPSGFKALCTQNLPNPAIPQPSKYFDVATRTGTGGAVSITRNFAPDLVWIKNRGAAADHGLNDSVRGAGKYLYSDTTGAEASYPTDLASFDASGYSFGAGSGAVDNASGNTYVDWFWKKGATAGFDIVSYAGNGTNRLVAHALGMAPDLMIVKQRDGGAGPRWIVWHSSFGVTDNDYVELNANYACPAINATGTDGVLAGLWNGTRPTSSVFSVGTHAWINSATGNYIAYLFASIPGFSRISKYTGNGAVDGPFVWCGFRPRFILLKRIDAVGDWIIYDTARDTYNVVSDALRPDLSNAETAIAGGSIDVTAGGFKLRGTLADINASGATIIFAAFAHYPFKTARAR